jgi:hypothetical protein
MADQNHLDILKQGVEAWNKWRLEHPDITPDLCSAFLSEIDLRGVNLNGAGLFETVLFRANLRDADLRTEYLRDVDLGFANLTKANLAGTNLREARLFRTDLSGADLSRVNLRRVDLSEEKLTGANLTEADLRFSRLVGVDLSNAILTGSLLYGTARDAWIVDGVLCNYVYWDPDGQERWPRDRDLAPGEFGKLYASLPIIEYIFENGMSPLDLMLMDRVVQAIRTRNSEYDLNIYSITTRGHAPSIKFTVALEEYKAPAQEQIKTDYEERIQRLENDKNRLQDAIAQLLENSRLQTQLLAATVDKVGGDIISIDGDGVVVKGSENVNVIIEQCQQHAHELHEAISKEPAKSKHFGKVTRKFGKLTKKKALDIVGGAIEDFGKKQVAEAAKTIVDLGKELGPLIVKTAAYAFFDSLIP